MQGRKTHSYKHAVLNLMRGSSVAAWTPYAALFSSPPSDTSAGTEFAGGSYARQAVTFGAPVDGEVANTASVEFPVATADLGDVAGIGIFDAVSGGNLKYWLDYEGAPYNVSTGSQFIFNIGDLVVKEDPEGH